ncbi:hypothetical protein SRHO_G00317590 [Serrasalmus rhombeus]
MTQPCQGCVLSTVLLVACRGCCRVLFAPRGVVLTLALWEWRRDKQVGLKVKGSGRSSAPVNTFLQQAIHRYTRAAETPVMNFNLLSAEGAAARGRLIKGKHPLQEEGVGVKVRGSARGQIEPELPP